MTSTIPLFRFTQIRDLNDPNSVSLRARHVPLFHGFEIEYPLAELHDASRYLNIEKIKAYLRTESFIARASIVQDLYMMSSGRFVGTFNPEYAPILPALRIAHGVAQCFRDRSEVSRHDLENLVSTWGDIGPLSGVPSEIFTLSALKDLSALYVTPMNHMDYRRLLAALRRVSYVSEQFEPSVIQTQLTELLDEEDTPIGGG